MKNKIIIIAISLFYMFSQLWAQTDHEMTVLEELTMQPLAANQYNPETKILNGKNVGKKVGKKAVLIKISLPDSRVSFSPTQVYSAEFKGGVWWVYFPVVGVGTLTINHPQYYPLDYNLKGFKFDQTQVYTMKIALPATDQNMGKAYITLTCQTPTKDAIILVSDQSGNQTQYTFDSNNRWRDNLPYGSYTYLVQAKGYQDCKGTFILKNEPVDVSVNLVAAVSNPTTINSTSPDSSLTFTVKGVSFKMIRVEGGTFITKNSYSVLPSYYIGETEVTQALWKAIMGNNPSNFKGNNRPVEQVSWWDCEIFIDKLNSLTDNIFRLPTERQWEYAARGGNKSQGYEYSGSNHHDNVAWHCFNSKKTRPVKTKSPNELGCYDMSGNVWEWCRDAWHDDGWGGNPLSDRVIRGGSWVGLPSWCLVSFRTAASCDLRSSNLGLRLVLSVDTVR